LLIFILGFVLEIFTKINRARGWSKVAVSVIGERPESGYEYDCQYDECFISHGSIPDFM
jgi:hypothetical protein